MMLEEGGEAAAASRDLAFLEVGHERRSALVVDSLQRMAQRLADHHAEEMDQGVQRGGAESCVFRARAL
jgi:hypothetical protein